MDIKTKDKVLQTVVNLQRDGILHNPVSALKQDFPEMNDSVIKAALYALLKDEYIYVLRLNHSKNLIPGGVTLYDDTLPLTYDEQMNLIDRFIFVYPEKAIGHLRKKKEEKRAAVEKWFWDTFKWLVTCLIPLLVGFYLGKR